VRTLPPSRAINNLEHTIDRPSHISIQSFSGAKIAPGTLTVVLPPKSVVFDAQ
jgi:hypothetical protein